MSVLHARRVVLRPVENADVPRLRKILAEPAVARWWTPEEDDETTRAFLVGEGALDDERIQTFVVTLEGEVVGWIAGWEKLDREFRHAGIDLFLSSTHHGKGLGPEAIARLALFLFEVRGHHRITIDPVAENRRAISAYEKVGFKKVGILRKYQLAEDGSFQDGMLLDLLPGELRRD